MTDDLLVWTAVVAAVVLLAVLGARLAGWSALPPVRILTGLTLVGAAGALLAYRRRHLTRSLPSPDWEERFAWLDDAAGEQAYDAQVASLAPARVRALRPLAYALVILAWILL